MLGSHTDMLSVNAFTAIVIDRISTSGIESSNNEKILDCIRRYPSNFVCGFFRRCRKGIIALLLNENRGETRTEFLLPTEMFIWQLKVNWA